MEINPGYGVAIQSAMMDLPFIRDVTPFIKDLLQLGLRPDKSAYETFARRGGDKQDLVLK
jgi:hypothetical protein